MARQVAAHLLSGRNLCVEAPTGVGKTFAYLVPAIHFALEQRRPVVISTHTISLQEQILEKDLPVLRKLMGVEFSATVAKGRGNYLCLRRLNALADTDQDLLPNASVLSELDGLLAWAKRTDSGSRSELQRPLSSALWDRVCCERGNCRNAQCSHFRSCHLMRSRRRIEKADLIIANHALFFSDLAMKREGREAGAGILPPYCGVILDEGHTIEDCASAHLGLRVGSFDLRRRLFRLFHPARGRGLLNRSDQIDARNAVRDAADRAERFFSRLLEWMEPQQRDPLRYTSPGHIPPLLDAPLERVEAELIPLAEVEDDDHATELSSIRDQIHEQRVGLHRFFEMELPDHVYWLERSGRARQEIGFHAVPVPISPLLSSALFGTKVPVVVASATLAVRNDLSFFQARVGMTEATSLILDTPFDYSRQVTLYVSPALPPPRMTPAFLESAAGHIRAFIEKTHGKAFVLFTSYEMMQEMAVALSDFFAEIGIELMVQGEGPPRSRMLDAFRESTDSVLFGTNSFWMGVDVPGEALSNVIIAKLPFAVPDHPLVAARQEDIERHGGNAFRDYALPDAVLKFRQGVGRLVRSREDTGIVVVLDSRIVTASYGRAFLGSIPECPIETF